MIETMNAMIQLVLLFCAAGAVAGVCYFLVKRQSALKSIEDHVCVLSIQDGDPLALEMFDQDRILFQRYLISPRRFRFKNLGEFHAYCVTSLENFLRFSCKGDGKEFREKLTILQTRMPVSSQTGAIAVHA